MAEMPNGHDRNWVILCGAIDGFRARYGKWPQRVRLYPDSLDDIRSLFSKEDYNHLLQSVQLVPEEAPMIAEDENGNIYSYGDEGFSEKKPDIHASDWLGIHPSPESDEL